MLEQLVQPKVVAAPSVIATRKRKMNKYAFRKRFARTIAHILLVLVTANSAQASKEGMLWLSTFSVESAGISSSGPVRIRGIAEHGHISNLEIHAFKKKFFLNPQQLFQIKNFAVNGLSLSFETGFKSSGGKILYVLLSQGLSAGPDSEKVIEISEENGIRIHQTRSIDR